jgi:RimJ/RimL family protein N-acetyltransferase
MENRNNSTIIRKAREEDAEAIVTLLKQLDIETVFMALEPGERQTTVEEERIIIKNALASHNSMIFVAEKDGQVIGCLGAQGGKVKRARHRIYITIGILQQYTNQGIGTRLFQEMEKWARENKFRRLELTTMTHNKAGFALYKKMGFEIEGIKKCSFIMDGCEIDEFYMAKII